MRFDLECINTGLIHSSNLNDIAETIYGESSLTPMLWDTKHGMDYQNSGSINTDYFQNFKNEIDSYFISGVPATSTLSLDSIIKKDGSVTPLISGGKFTSHRKTNTWSNDTIIGIVDYDYSSGYYKYKIDQDYDIDELSIYTVATLDNNYLQIKKEYVYVEYDGTSVSSTFSNADKTLDHIYTIYNSNVYLNSSVIAYNESLGTYNGGNAIFKLKEFPVKNLSVVGFTSDRYKIASGAIVFENYSDSRITVGTEVRASYYVTPFISYKQTSRENKESDIVFKNINISPKSVNFKNGTLGVHTCYGVDIMPTDVDIVEISNTTIDYKNSAKVTAQIKGAGEIPLLKLTEDNEGVTLKILSDNAVWQETGTSEYYGSTGIDGTIRATLGINQDNIGMYVQKEWVSNVTIDGKQRGQLTLPYKLPMLGDADRAYNSDDFKKIYLYIIYNDDPILGKLSPVDNEQTIVEYYTFKSNNTNKDPDYLKEETLKSYYINGRKVGYVKLAQLTDNPSNITSVFIKPISIEIKKDKSEIYFRDLFIKSKNISTRIRGTDGKAYRCIQHHIASPINRPGFGEVWNRYWVVDTSYSPIANWIEGTSYFPTEQYVGQSSSQIYDTRVVSSDKTIVSDGRYETGVLPNDNMTLMATSVNNRTVITYNDAFPNDQQILGYWLVTDREITVQAVYDDKYIRLESDVKTIEMKSLQSESSFTISGFDTPGVNTTLSEFGYLSISDYIKSPFGLNSASYYCINSDCINKQCIHKNVGYRSNFILDSTKIACARNESYESEHPEIGHCPGLDVRLVNPFIMPTDVV